MAKVKINWLELGLEIVRVIIAALAGGAAAASNITF